MTIAIFLPSLGALILAWVGFYNFEKTMINITGSYIQNATQSTAARIESSFLNRAPDGIWENFEKSKAETRKKIIGIEDSFARFGMFAIYDHSGSILYGTPDFHIVAPYWDTRTRTTEPLHVIIPNKGHYTLTMYPVVGGNLFLVGAVSWDALLGTLVPLSVIWPLFVGLLGIIGFFLVYLMWTKVIMPLKYLETEVSVLKWGEDIPEENTDDTVIELQRLRNALITLSKSAIEKNEISQRYVKDIILVQEEERSRISREIHDGPLQDVTALIQRLRLLLSYKDISENLKEPLDEAKTVALECVKEMREFCNNLTPPWLDLGLSQALTELTDRQRKQLGTTIVTDIRDVEELPDDVVTAFFRITQEAINNAVHHAKADIIKVELTKKDNLLMLLIEDDGSGFDVPKDFTILRTQGHRGLSNMRERVYLIGGDLKIKSSKHTGTQITVTYQI